MSHAVAESPFTDLDVTGDWEFSMEIDLNGTYHTIESGGENGRWRLRVQPITGYDDSGVVQHGEPLLDLRDQTTRPTPLEWLAGLMSGGAA